MFDIGISEIALIAVVALVVIGPERLPKVARTIGTLLGRAQRYVNDVKAEVNREMELDELKKLQTQMQDAARGIQDEVSSAGAQMHSAVQSVEKELQEGIAPATAAGTPTIPAPPQWDPGVMPPAIEPPGPVERPALAEPPPNPALVDAQHDGLFDAGPKPAQSSLFPEQTIR